MPLQRVIVSIMIARGNASHASMILTMSIMSVSTHQAERFCANPAERS
jgi:hypothetical protein